MNKHLKDADSATPRKPATDRPALTLPGSRTKRPWVNWLFVVGVAFGVYVYLGHNFLKKEYTWAHIRGTLEGRMEASAVREATAAKGEQAAALIEATTAQEVARAASQAVTVGLETLPIDVKRAAEIAKTQALIDIERQKVLNALDLKKTEQEVTLRADGERQRIQATVYDECMAAAARAGTEATSSTANSGKGTGGDSLAAGIMATAMAQSRCEEYKAARDAVTEAAGRVNNSQTGQ